MFIGYFFNIPQAYIMYMYIYGDHVFHVHIHCIRCLFTLIFQFSLLIISSNVNYRTIILMFPIMLIVT